MVKAGTALKALREAIDALAVKAKANGAAASGDGDGDGEAKAEDPYKSAKAAIAQTAKAGVHSWTKAKQKVDLDVNKLRAAMRKYNDPNAARIADEALTGLTNDLQGALISSLAELARAKPEKEQDARKAAQAAVKDCRKALQNNKKGIDLLENNPFGVPIEISQVLEQAFVEIDAGLSGH